MISFLFVSEWVSLMFLFILIMLPINMWIETFLFIGWHDGCTEIYLYKSSVKGSNNGLDVSSKIKNGYVDECDIYMLIRKWCIN
jgi:hypothetical protein